MKKLFALPAFAKAMVGFLVPICLLLCFSNCASWKQNRWLSAHQKELSRLANSDLPTEQKLDGLVQDYVKFMNEDLKFVNPVKGVKYVKKYHDQNRASMEKILRESEKWQGSLGTLDKIALGVRTVQKPYIGDLIDLGPKFKRKYKQYAFALELASKITGGLTRFVGKELF
ncbi:MAG: hypothetical protein ACKVUS_05705 [Saprospiraceae bacterium]